MIKLPDCKNCIKNDVCSHAIYDYVLTQGLVDSTINKIENKTPFEAEIELKIMCKSFAESVESVKKEPKFTRQEVIDKLKELADGYKLTLFVADNWCGSTAECVRIIFYDWPFKEGLSALQLDLLELSDDRIIFYDRPFKEGLLALQLDLLELSDGWLKCVKDQLTEKMRYRMNFHTEEDW